MAGVTLPWLVVTGKLDALRSLTEEILATLDRWPPVLQILPVVRALAAAEGERERRGDERRRRNAHKRGEKAGRKDARRSVSSSKRQ